MALVAQRITNSGAAAFEMWKVGTFLVLAFRVLFFASAVIALGSVIDLGTSTQGLIAASTLGVLAASRLAFTRARWGLIALLSLLFWTMHLGLFYLADSLQSSYGSVSFWSYDLREHSAAILAIFTLSAAATWFFWRARHAITLEAVFLAAVLVSLFAAHRGFRLDRPKFINTLAWTMGWEPLTMFVVTGAIITGSILLYLLIASLTPRPVEGMDRFVVKRSAHNIILSLVAFSCVAAVFFFVAKALYVHYSSDLLSRTANGVGQVTSEDMNPLGFHSALGGSAQPAALVRLEGDYGQNPWSPMLYLRESALSRFNGSSMISAGRAYDTDVAGITPRGTFTGKEDVELATRTPVVHSVYVMANQENAFAIDYPLSIVQLKNPRPGQFRAAYRAYSAAPTTPLADLSSLPVGDPRWSPEAQKHYLAEHPDPRYKKLALDITKNAELPVEKMLAIINYLDRTAIYTLSPNHEVKPNEDPVSPFLFGDMRGYCVHFAHAIVYMARSLGIPSRIGTGYLTDLSQAKDGHVLLRMSDRHAWAEVYITGQGWIPFDVKPDQVESHAETEVDMKMLEDLMGMLEPGEEILPKDVIKDEPNVVEPSKFALPSASKFLYTLVLAWLALVLFKLYLWFGWMIPIGQRSRAVRMYASVVARARDLGWSRETGETRVAYAERLEREARINFKGLTNQFIRGTFGREQSFDLAALNEQRRAAGMDVKKIVWWRKVLAALSLRSVLSRLEGSRW